MSFPNQFSFIENPVGTLASLREFVGRTMTRNTQHAYIDQADCTLIDHGAESVLSALGVEASGSLGMRFGGRFPDAAREREIVLATGIPRALRVPLPEPPGFMTFPLFRGRAGNIESGSSQLAERVADRLADYVNRCLAVYGFGLSRSGAEFLTALVSEMLGNAEEHSGRRHWWVSGYLRQPKDQPYGDCHITIFNFGRTLSQSISELPPESLLSRQIDDLLQRHKGGFMPRRWEPENLRTIYALQEGVSRKNIESDRIGHRGKGTADLINFFQKLGQATDGRVTPQMCLVSGNTHILFDGRYEMRSMPFHDGQEAQVIAFNKQNDLSRPPDPNVVRWLPKPFPGTLISMKFYFDPAHLLRLKSEQ